MVIGSVLEGWTASFAKGKSEYSPFAVRSSKAFLRLLALTLSIFAGASPLLSK